MLDVEDVGLLCTQGGWVGSLPTPKDLPGCADKSKRKRSSELLAACCSQESEHKSEQLSYKQLKLRYWLANPKKGF